jgi:choline dehydrogenase
LFPYFIKLERFMPPTDGRNVTGDYNPAVHGFDGLSRVSLPNRVENPFDQNVFAAAHELGGIFNVTLDWNSGNPLGTGWTQATIGGGERSSSATAYLTTDVLARTNLHVLLNTRATRIQKSNSSNSHGPEFGNIEVVGNGKSLRTFEATKEVILSAGSIGSPHILFHSGFGDEEELKSVGIKPLVKLPSLGKNLTDHPTLQLDFAANTTEQSVLFNSTLLDAALDEWKKSRTGPLSDIANNQVIWCRMETTSPFEDPSAGSRSPHWEFIPVVNLKPTPSPGVTAIVSIVSPASRGMLSINSSNPLDPPLIDPAFFTSPVDAAAGRDAIRNIRKFFGAKAWEGYIGAEQPPLAGAESDDELDTFISGNFVTTWHPVSTAMMSPHGADYGVVDPDLKVKGIGGLRIVDASVMPFITAGNTQVAVYTIAERAADIIRNDWCGGSQGKC